jgi:hypothetical protein
MLTLGEYDLELLVLWSVVVQAHWAEPWEDCVWRTKDWGRDVREDALVVKWRGTVAGILPA